MATDSIDPPYLMLKNDPNFWQEGLWDSAMAAVIARRCMEIEEKNLTTFDGSEFPAETDRMHVTLWILTAIAASEIKADRRTDTTSTSIPK